MRNRSRFIIQRNEYDMMMGIAHNTGFCPILALCGEYADNPECRGCGGEIGHCTDIDTTCSECIQKWLNEEEKR